MEVGRELSSQTQMNLRLQMLLEILYEQSFQTLVYLWFISQGQRIKNINTVTALFDYFNTASINILKQSHQLFVSINM